MSRVIIHRSILVFSCVIALTACGTPEQQAGPATPVSPPQVAQAPVEELEMRTEPQAVSAEPAAEAPRKLLREQRALTMDAFQAGAAAPLHPLPEQPDDQAVASDNERYQHLDQNPVQRVAEHPVSTFSIDVDTGAYANVRRFLNAGQLPPRDAVRVEEMINYFSYGYAPPADNVHPFAVHTEVVPTPWNTHTHLLRVALKGRESSKAALPPANLVFLIDVSGSMSDANKLPLLKSAFKALTRELRPRDRVSLVVYAGASGVVLEPTAGDQQERILTALERLSAGGSTHGAAGIELAYALAQRAFIAGGINRVLLATDGDFNVGVTHFERLKDLIEEKRKTGIALSTLGFGTGNFNERMMEQLADAGNGNYSYIDTLNEARKVLVEEFTSTMATIARDVKIQVEFNPASVAEYRLIGYENRALRREDFNNDQVNAGEIGAGHSVTALYEIRLAGAPGSLIDPLRYGDSEAAVGKVASRTVELAHLRLRYKGPDGGNSQRIDFPILRDTIKSSLAQAGDDLRFAISVAAFGQLLKGGSHLGDGRDGCADDKMAVHCGKAATAFGFNDVAQLARGAVSTDRYGYRAEFLELVATARRLSATTHDDHAAWREE